MTGMSEPRMTPAREISERFRSEHERGVVAKGRRGRGCSLGKGGWKVERSRDPRLGGDDGEEGAGLVIFTLS